MKIQTPEKLAKMWEPRGSYDFRVLKGGRGSGKSFTVAQIAAVFGCYEKLRILCAREIQKSIKDSFHAELKNAISSIDFLAENYDCGVDYLRGKNGTEFIFKGLYRNIDSVKSLSGIDICIVEEAEQIAEESWLALEPTIRKANSEIWCIYNPKRKNSPVDRRFVQHVPERSLIITCNWSDNHFLSNVLLRQRKRALETLPPEVYAHVWEGAYLETTEAQIFRDCYKVKDFTVSDSWDGPYIGLDFGYAEDPTACVKCYIDADKDLLYISSEFCRKRVELDELYDEIAAFIPECANHVVRADSSRPDSISYLKRHGMSHIESAIKGSGSIEEGITRLKAFNKIIIHPRCTDTVNEFLLYSYKIDRLSGDIKPAAVDAHNHCIDALRYAIEPITKMKDDNFIDSVDW